MSQARILIIEDEPKVALFIKKGLEEHQFSAQIAYTGPEGKELALTNNFDLVILDLNLPFMSGHEVCREIRKINAGIPVLMLTALSTTEDKLDGFNNGADDYLVKPFEFRELLARIKALIKRSGVKKVHSSLLRAADLELDTESKRVTRNNIPIDLTAKEYLLLELLMVNKGRVVSRLEIAEKIWEINFDTGTNVIDVYINFLRRKIDKNFPVKLIHTYIGMGYLIKEAE